MEKSNVMGRVDRLKGELIGGLSQMDLVGKIVNARDLMDFFTGGSLSGDLSGVSGFVRVSGQEGDIIRLEDDFGDDLGEDFELQQFGLEFLIELLD